VFLADADIVSLLSPVLPVRHEAAQRRGRALDRREDSLAGVDELLPRGVDRAPTRLVRRVRLAEDERDGLRRAPADFGETPNEVLQPAGEIGPPQRLGDAKAEELLSKL
jgi:hypothetical protein